MGNIGLSYIAHVRWFSMLDQMAMHELEIAFVSVI